MQAITIYFQLIILINYYKIRKFIKKRCSSNCKNLQARKNFLKISKPAEIWWGTPFMRNSSWGTLHLSWKLNYGRNRYEHLKLFIFQNKICFAFPHHIPARYWYANCLFHKLVRQAYNINVIDMHPISYRWRLKMKYV